MSRLNGLPGYDNWLASPYTDAPNTDALDAWLDACPFPLSGNTVDLIRADSDEAIASRDDREPDEPEICGEFYDGT